MDGKNRNISIENIVEYISREKILYLTSRSVIEKLKVGPLIIVALFFSGMILVIATIGFYFVLLLKERNQTFFEVEDVFANLLHNGIYAWIMITILYFFIFIYVLFKNFYKNKIKRLFYIVTVLITYLVCFTIIFSLVSIVFIPILIGESLRYTLLSISFLLYVLFSLYWIRKRIKVFYNESKRSQIDIIINKIKVWMWPFLGIISVWSYATAPFRRDARLMLYGAISPFFILLIIPLSYLTFYFTLGYLIELYYMNKYPEAIRMETDFTKEEWYGPKYQKSKEVMRKIKEFEDYINN